MLGENGDNGIDDGGSGQGSERSESATEAGDSEMCSSTVGMDKRWGARLGGGDCIGCTVLTLARGGSSRTNASGAEGR